MSKPTRLLPIAWGLLVLLLPGRALAWGPAAHIDFGLQVLKDLLLLAPAVAALLRSFPLDFLYGNIAADITVGKNLSPYRLHCHNWQVGSTVLELANDDAGRAFAWGYLSHLAADIVAHNYFVPYQTVEHFERRRASHVGWEIRFDTWARPESWQAARAISSRAFRRHDILLSRILVGPLFSFPVNRQIFSSFMVANRVLRWRRAARTLDRRSPLALDAAEVEEARRLSLQRVHTLLSVGLEAPLLQADPAGHRNLLLARDVRRNLFELARQGRLRHRDRIGPRYRDAFRDSLDGSLHLPLLEEFSLPSAANAKTPSRGRRALGLVKAAGQSVWNGSRKRGRALLTKLRERRRR